jgi:hypothetical protein
VDHRTATDTSERPEGPAPSGVDTDAAADGRAAVRAASITFLAVVAVLVAVTLLLTGGTLTYPLDDPAIHLAVARRLAFDGTWGVVAGEYQAASSSPVWTLLLAPTQLVARGARGEAVPLLFNVVAGLWVVRLLRPDLAQLRPSRRRPVDGLAVAGLVVGPLFLPGLAVLGMEHLLHMGLVLAVALAVEARWAASDLAPASWLARAPRWAPFGLMALATGVRFESVALIPAFAAGFALSAPRPDPSRPTERGAWWRRRAAALAGLGLASAAVVVMTGAINVAYGQRILPNSVVLKSLGVRGDARRSLGATVERFTSDPLLVAFALVAVLAIVAAVRARPRAAPALFPAAVTLVAIAVHSWLGAVDVSLRYQAYLYGLGTLTLLRAVPAFRAVVARRWPRVPAAAIVLAFLPVAYSAVAITVDQPDDAAVTWEQRYQVARFLHDNYRDAPVAIGELGYISLYHDGPLTDVYGLADHEVLEAWMDDRVGADFWDALQRRRGFRVLVTYSFTLDREEPDGWFPVAEWRSPDAYYETTRFWATEPEEVAPLIARLRAFEPELPAGVDVRYNDLAALAASDRMQPEAAG